MFKLNLNKVFGILSKRKPKTQTFSEYGTQGKVGMYADLWKTHREDIMNQMTALLIARLEKGFTDKKTEEGYREGLKEIARLWDSCYNEVEVRKRH